MLGQIIGLLVCFVLYIISIFVFARIYHNLYKGRHQRFFFIEDILLGRKEEVENQLSDKIQDLKTKIEMLQHELEMLQDIVEELEQGADIEQLAIQNKSSTLPSGNKYDISKQYDNVFVIGMSPPEGEIVEFIELNIENSHGKRLKRIVFDEPYPNYEFKEYHLRCRAELTQRREELTDDEQRLKDVKDYSPTIWSYWHFFYFSVGAQTTLGYGDMLPNSAVVRRLVIVQVFLGLAILVLLINFVILLFRP